MTSRERSYNPVVSQDTKIRLGLLLAIVGLLGSGLAGCLWWASRTTTQLESIHRLLLVLQTNDALQAKDLVDMQSQVRLLQVAGSPQVQLLQGKYNDMQERVKVLESQLTHFATLEARIATLESAYLKSMIWKP